MNWNREYFFVTLGVALTLLCLPGRPAAAEDAAQAAPVTGEGRQSVKEYIGSLLFPGHNRFGQDSGTGIAPENLRRCFVIGQVNKPGIYSLPEKIEIHVLDAISEAGGADGHGEQRRVTVTRRINGKSVMLKVNLPNLYRGLTAENYLLQDQDVIFIPSRSLTDGATRPFLTPFSSLFYRLSNLRFFY